MSQFVVLLRPARAEMPEAPTPSEIEAVQAHYQRLVGLTHEGVVLLAGRTQDSGPDTVGIVVLQARDRAAAEALMASDPAVERGVMTARLFPYAIATANPDALRDLLD